MSEDTKKTEDNRKMSEEKIDSATAVNETRRQFEEYLNDKTKTDDAIEKLLHEREKEKFLREQEDTDLKQTFCEKDEDHAIKRKFMLKMLELEQELDYERSKQAGKTQIEIEIFELEAKKKRIQLECDISLAKIEEAARIEKEINADLAKDRADLQITELINNQVLNTKRMNSEIALNEERQKMLRVLEEEEGHLRLKLEAEKVLHEQGIEKTHLHQEHELKKLTAMIGLSPEEIIALTADPSALAKVLEEKYKGSPKDDIDKLYKMVMEEKDKALKDKEVSIERIERILMYLIDNTKPTIDPPKSKLMWKLAGAGVFLALICVAALLLGSLYVIPKEGVPEGKAATGPNQPKALEGSNQAMNVVINNNPVGDTSNPPKSKRQAGSKKPDALDKGKVAGDKPVKVTSQHGVIPSPVVTHIAESNKTRSILAEVNACLEGKGYKKLVDMQQVIPYHGFYLASGTARPNLSDKTDSQREDSAKRKARAFAKSNLTEWKNASVNSEKTTHDIDEKREVIERSEGIITEPEPVCSSYDNIGQIAQVVLKIPMR